MVNATLEALKYMQSPRQVATRRGKKIADVVAQREGTKAGEAVDAADGSDE
jgi:small subunit ribosomal protein S5